MKRHGARRAELDVRIAVNARRRDRASVHRVLLRVARHVLHAEGFRRGRLDVAVVGARRMSALHKRYLNDPTPTDVLTFDLSAQTDARTIDGQIVMCADVAIQRSRRRAPTRRVDERTDPEFLAELALYLAHGVLHLAGYDDGSPAEFRRMHAREDQLLAQLGFGPRFAAGEQLRSRKAARKT